jgi:hypothetical protein
MIRVGRTLAIQPAARNPEAGNSLSSFIVGKADRVELFFRWQWKRGFARQFLRPLSISYHV